MRTGYGGVRALVQVGWSLPPTPALERAVGGVTGLMPGRLLGVGVVDGPGGLRLRDGSGYRVERPVHPDPAVEELRRRKTEGEMAQALWRARWSRRDAKTPLDVWVLSPLPVPGLVVDRVLRWAEVVGRGLRSPSGGWAACCPARTAKKLIRPTHHHAASR